MDVRMYGRTYRFPLYSTGLRPLRFPPGPLPKKPSGELSAMEPELEGFRGLHQIRNHPQSVTAYHRFIIRPSLNYKSWPTTISCSEQCTRICDARAKLSNFRPPREASMSFSYRTWTHSSLLTTSFIPFHPRLGFVTSVSTTFCLRTA